jgi:YidC/Oxa1 family membrane protein insertase
MPLSLHHAAALPIIGSAIGQFFQPLYQAMAWILAASYALVPNYALAIALLTVLVMAVTAPLTIKSSRSARAMQRLLPELKKIQQKYKGDRVRLNQEMLALYRRHGVSPAGGFLPALLQIPVYIVLYGVIRGLAHTVDAGRVASPLYVNRATALAQSVHAHPGHLQAFGLNLSSSLFSVHPSWVAALPYAALVLGAIAIQWLQTWQMNRRAPGGGATAVPAWQRYLPVVFALVYLRLPAGVIVYVIVSAFCRMAIQWVAMRAPNENTAVTTVELWEPT